MMDDEFTKKYKFGEGGGGERGHYYYYYYTTKLRVLT